MPGLPIFRMSVENVEFIGRLPGHVRDLKDRWRNNDRHALDSMVSGSKAAAPDKSGELVNGIAGETDERTSTFSAHAISPHGEHEDYALFVEKGHGSGVADDGYFAGDGAAALRSRKRGGGAAPRPFFYPASVQPLADRLVEAERSVVDMIDRMIED